MTTIDLAAIAKEVSTVDEAIMRVLPFISTVVGFVPDPAAKSVAASLPLIGELLASLDNAAKAVAAGNTGAGISEILTEVKNHLTKGKPNSPALT